MTEWNTGVSPNWCPGCGNFGILMAVKAAMNDLNLEPHKVLLVSGIGCSSKLPYFVKTYGFQSLHGRPLPVATAAKLANHSLTVVAVAGDGDGYGEGTNHFIHSLRRNVDMTYVVHNNMVYGLTTGQTSPTSEKGFKTKTTPDGVIEVPINPIALAIAAGATFVARGFAGDVNHLKKLVMAGIQHRGFALIDVLQPCVTFNKVNTYEFYRQRCYKLEESGHNTSDKNAAFAKSQEWGDRIPIGIFYQAQRKCYEDELPQIKDTPLAMQDISHVDISKAVEEFI